MLVILTRPEKESKRLSALLEKQKFKTRIEPLITIAALDINVPPADSYLITSKTAASILTDSPQYKKIQDKIIYVVGRESTQIIKAAGFKNAKFIGKNIAELKVKLKALPIYLSGDVVSDDLQGIVAKRCIIYKTSEVVAFSQEMLLTMQENEGCAVLFYSSRTAGVFTRLIKKSRLENLLGGSYCICLSKAISDKIEESDWKGVLAASNPTEKNLLSTLYRLRDEF